MRVLFLAMIESNALGLRGSSLLGLRLSGSLRHIYQGASRSISS